MVKYEYKHKNKRKVGEFKMKKITSMVVAAILFTASLGINVSARTDDPDLPVPSLRTYKVQRYMHPDDPDLPVPRMVKHSIQRSVMPDDPDLPVPR